jgi:hypothetical protein
MGFAVAVLLAVGALLYTLLIRAKDIPEVPPESPVVHLEERKARIYENLRDLQFEYRLGKLSDEDYQKTKQSLQRELATVLSEIDALQPAALKEAVPKTTAAKAAASVPKLPPGEVSDTCAKCGAHFPHPLRYCGVCGKAMVS